MKLITQFKNWILNITGHKNSPIYTVFICIIIILMLVAVGYSQEIEKLENIVNEQSLELKKRYINEMDSIYIITLKDEIMEIGSELDSMKLKYD